MEKYNILDCTLRDGGYINNWEFPKKIANQIMASLYTADIEVIECGYLTQKKHKENSTLFKSIEAFQNYFNLENHKHDYVLMINQGDYNIHDLPDANTNQLSGIRLAFHKKNLSIALNEAKIIKEKGYKLYFQPMIVKSYTEEEFIHLLKKTNVLNPNVFYIVDSFGSLDKHDFLRYLYLSEHILDDDISIGFHGHNNMQYVYANAVNFIENALNRNIIIDSSISGMGRGAGNLNTEVITSYLNKYYKKNYTIEPLLEVMDNYIEPIYRKNPWGFSSAQFLSAKHECHPNYANFLTVKKKLTISGINEILSDIDDDHKKSYLPEYINEKYLNYNKRKTSLSKKFDISFLENKSIILLGSGKSVQTYQNSIKGIQKEEDTVSIFINHIDDSFSYDFVFFANQKRYSEYNNQTTPSKAIVTSNIKMNTNEHFLIDYNDILEEKLNNYDNALTLFLSYLTKVKVKKVYLAGIDGYNKSSENYSLEDIVLTDKAYMQIENDALNKTIKFYAQKLPIEFITPSTFQSAIQPTIIGVIPARYKSSRFEGKPLCIINGIPMIKRTYEQVKKSKLLNKIVVATEDKRIEEYCISENIPVIMTSDKCLTGTDRIAEVAQKEHYDLYINIQGDEPVIDSRSIDEIIQEYTKYGEEYIAYNLYKLETNMNEVNSDTIIKAIVNEKDELMYMSRLPVPFNKSNKNTIYKKQVCVYGFTKKALELFSTRNKTLNEQYEDIEILRFIDMGYKVKMKETFVDSIAVDIPDDIKKVENFLNKK